MESVNLYGGVYHCRGGTLSQDVVSSSHSFHPVKGFFLSKSGKTYKFLNHRNEKCYMRKTGSVDFPE